MPIRLLLAVLGVLFVVLVARALLGWGRPPDLEAFVRSRWVRLIAVVWLVYAVVRVVLVW